MASRRADARLGERQQVLRAGLVEAQGPADRPQHVGRGVDPPALLEPRVPGDRHPGKHRHLLSAQARRSARPPGGQTDLRRGHRVAPGTEELGERGAVVGRAGRGRSPQFSTPAPPTKSHDAGGEHVGDRPLRYRHSMDVVVADVPANLADYELADRYRVEDGRVFLSGLQALARLPVDQLRIDRRNGLHTAAFVSGYQGSPVGTFQEEVSRAAAHGARPADRGPARRSTRSSPPPR